MNHTAVIRQDFYGYVIERATHPPCRSGQESSTQSHSNFGLGAGRLLVYRRLVDLPDRGVELGVELLVGLVFGQPFEKRAREAGDEGGIAGEPSAGLVPAVAARQG